MSTRIRRLALASLVVLCVAFGLVRVSADTFTALCGGGTGCAYQTGDKFGYQTVEKIRQNFNALLAPKYWTAASDSNLTNEVNLGALTSGLLKIAVSGSVATPSTVAAPTGAVVGTTDTQALTNKTILCHAITATLQACGATITITDAQLKALPSTPISIVSTPGASKRLVVIKGLWRANTSAGAYTNISGVLSKLRLVYGNNLTVASEELDASNGTDLATFLGTAAVQEVVLHDWTEAIEAVANTDNQAIEVSIDNNGSGNYTGGNSANTLAISFGYYIVG